MFRKSEQTKPAYRLNYVNVDVLMLTGVIDKVTMGEQHRQWILGLLYSTFGKTQVFHFFSSHQPNFRLQNISIILFVALPISSQKLLNYKYYWRDIYSPCTLNLRQCIR
jgi:hypothetical protein